MFKLLADNTDPRSLATRLRKKRNVFFLDLVAHLNGPISILDVGGTEQFWQGVVPNLRADVSITVLNLFAPPISTPNIESVQGDARHLQFASASFDVVFSNSVIEHVGDSEDQRRMAAEVCRVGQRYFIQTPNRYFFIEPHFLFPFFQFLPLQWRVRLLQHFNLGWCKREPDPVAARALVESIRLLAKKEFQQLFPGCQLYEEKFFGLTKSFIAYSGWPLTGR